MLVLKSCNILDFHSVYYIPDIEILASHLPYVYIPGKIIVQVNYMKYLLADKICLSENAHIIIQKYLKYLVNNLTHNIFLGLSPFLWRELHKIYFENLNH